jgi:GntR family transcriptional regulator, transcriptional repressor for pyruvate dehydrogenase complex
VGLTRPTHLGEATGNLLRRETGRIMETDANKENSLFTPLQEKRTFKEIEKQIRELIRSRALKAGDRLPSEKDLAVQFKAGRLSVREALRMIEQAGLIVVKQGSKGGSFVRELDETVTVESMIDLMWQGDIFIRDVTDARSAVESLILRKAFENLTEESLLALERSVQELEILAAEGRQETYSVDPTLTDFHLLLARTTNNPVFPIILKVLIEVAVRVMTPPTVGLERLRKHVTSHRLIVTALRKGDLEGAVRALEEHLVVIGNRQSDQTGSEGG